MIGGDVAGQPRLFDQGHVAQRPAVADLAAGLGDRQVAGAGQHRRQGAGAGVLPLVAGVEDRGGPGGHGVDARQLTTQDLDGVDVGEGGGISGAQLVDHGGQLGQ